LHAFSAVQAKLDRVFAQLDVLYVRVHGLQVVEDGTDGLVGSATVAIGAVDCEDLSGLSHRCHLRFTFTTVFCAGKSWMAEAPGPVELRIASDPVMS
jgi:hypothetical protein